VLDQVRGVGSAYPGCGDKQRACRGSAQDRHRVGGRTEPTWPPRSPGCRTRRAHVRPGRAGKPSRKSLSVIVRV
jgi:hypothetical protein